MSDQTPGGRSILICCEQTDEVQPLADALSQDGKVQLFDQSAIAWEFAQQTRNLDLIILGIEMAQADGYAVLEKLKANRDTQRIPVAFLATAEQIQTPEKGLTGGAADFIETPINVALTARRMRTLLDLRRTTDLLENVARLDFGTGLPNRRQFDDMLATEWKRGLRTRASLSVIMIEMDAKPISPHANSDEPNPLLEISKIITATLTRPGDLFAHGGPEADFVVALPNTNGAGAMEVAERIRGQVSKLPLRGPTLEKTSICVGVASTIPTNRSGPEAFAEAATNCLRAAQSSGPSRIQGQTLRTD